MADSPVPTELDLVLGDEVHSLLLELGTTVTLTIPSGVARWNPDTFSLVDEDGPTVATVKSTPPFPYVQGRFTVAPTSVVEGRSICYISAKNVGVVPKPGASLEIDGEKWSVIFAGSIRSGELVALWELTIERLGG